MTNLDEINPHLALWHRETYVSPNERDWLAFCDDVQSKLNLADLDGDQETDGYSIDMVFDLFDSDETVEDAVIQLRAEMAAIHEPEGNWWHPASA